MELDLLGPYKTQGLAEYQRAGIAQREQQRTNYKSHNPTKAQHTYLKPHISAAHGDSAFDDLNSWQIFPLLLSQTHSNF